MSRTVDTLSRPPSAAPAKAAGRRRAEMLQRARDLVPAIKARAEETERLGRLPEATVAEFHAAGLWRVVQPARVGGGGFDFGIIVELGDILGLACGSTAWTFANLACHHWMLALWPAAAQEAVWGADPDSLIATSVIYPAGRATRVAGGYRLTGRWPFCSGILHSDWSIHGALVEPEVAGNAPEARIFLLPKSALEIFDTWQVMGLAGTGSRDVACTDLFVPEDMTVGAHQVKGGDHPGMAADPSPLYRLPLAALFSHPIAAPLLGIAHGAYADTVEIIRGRSGTFNRSKMRDYATLQRRVAKAGALIDGARLLLEADCAEALAVAETGRAPGDEERFRWRRNAAHAADMSIEAVDLLYHAVGGSAIYSDHPLQRRFRDVHAGANHIGVSFDVNGTAYGRIALGLVPDNPII